jgi:hypothetical protein
MNGGREQAILTLDNDPEDPNQTVVLMIGKVG